MSKHLERKKRWKEDMYRSLSLRMKGEGRMGGSKEDLIPIGETTCEKTDEKRKNSPSP